MFDKSFNEIYYRCMRKIDIEATNKSYKFYRKRRVASYAKIFFLFFFSLQTIYHVRKNVEISVQEHPTPDKDTLRVTYRATINHNTLLLRYVI